MSHETKAKKTDSKQRKPPQYDTSGLTPDEKLALEIDWCIEQLEKGMQNRKGSQKQLQEAARVIKILQSSKAPLVKKRQAMHSTFGDYRAKMTKDQDFLKRHLQKAEISPVKDCKAIYYHRAKPKTYESEAPPPEFTFSFDV